MSGVGNDRFVVFDWIQLYNREPSNIFMTFFNSVLQNDYKDLCYKIIKVYYAKIIQILL